MITVKNLKKTFDDTPVLESINLEVKKGEVVCLVGASGSGKTTLLRCLNLLETPDEGSIRIGDKILLLNVCIELPVGFANKLENSDILSLPIGDLMIIVDELKEPLISENPRTQKLDEYIKLRSELLGILTDSELTIMISILYNPHLDILLKNKDKIELNSDESLTRINQLYGLLLEALINIESEEYKLVEANYKGVLRDLMFDFDE
jgi:ABC-type oligopeptide transport system ATPase subunit